MLAHSKTHKCHKTFCIMQSRQMSSSDIANIKIVTTDSQQMLPCMSSVLQEEIVWFYDSLCIYDIYKEGGSMFVWDEVTSTIC